MALDGVGYVRPFMFSFLFSFFRGLDVVMV